MCSRGFKRLYKINLGRTKYRAAWEIQKKLVGLRFESKIPDCLIFTEHEPVITKGRATNNQNLLISPFELRRRNIEICEVERGGDITFHGPGQAVLYPIIDLNNRGRDLHDYLRSLENLVIETLKDIGLSATTKKGLTGVWVGTTKLAAIGVAVSRWITYHGLALNVTTDLDNYKMINPCGITEFPVGSIESLTGKKYELGQIERMLADNYARMFSYEMEEMSIDGIFESVKI